MTRAVRRFVKALTLASCALPPATVTAQGFSFQVGRLLTDGGWTSYTGSWLRPLAGPAALTVGGTFMQGSGTTGRHLFGANLDLSLFRGGRPGAYAVAGVSGGFGAGGAESWWRSWSAGAGYELMPLRVVSVGVEARYREFGPRIRSGMELSFRIAALLGAAAVTPPLTTAERAPRKVPAREAEVTELPLSTAATGGRPTSSAARVLDGVIATADSAIGARYRLGGLGEDGRGFDCSGLIQYAYGRHGISLPRRSVEQAREGREVGRDLEALRPGDLLTFSSSGHGITHVGLYAGGGRFIHSASSGVQASTLSAEDPYGKWWFKRWVGARRIVE